MNFGKKIGLLNITKRIGRIDTELKNLFEMRIAGKITAIGDRSPDEVYEEYKQKKENERIQLLGTQNKLETNSLDWQKKASNFFLLCQNAEKYFLKAEELPQYLFLRKVSSNLFLNERKVVVEHRFPFSYLVELNTHPSRLEKWVQFRTTDWMTELDYPEYTAKEVKRFLQC